MPRRPREFPVEIPDYIRREINDPASEYEQLNWIMRSEYERRQALRLIENNIFFLYEVVALEYLAKVHNGMCLDCESANIGSVRTYTPDFYFPESNIFEKQKGSLIPRTAPR